MEKLTERFYDGYFVYWMIGLGVTTKECINKLGKIEEIINDNKIETMNELERAIKIGKSILDNYNKKSNNVEDK